MRRLRDDEAGATAVEFALLVLPLVLVVFGALEFGRALWARNALQEIAIATARCMGVKETACAPGGTFDSASAVAYVQSLGSSRAIAIPSAGIALEADANCTGLAGFSKATVTYTFRTVVPLVITPLADGVTLTGTACFPNQS